MVHPLVISIGLNFITFYFVGLSNIWAQDQAIKNINIFPLQDQSFKLIPYNPDLSYYNDYVLYFVLFMTLSMTLFNKGKRIEILLRWSIMLNILFTFRVIMVPSTILTSPVNPNVEWKHCKTLGYDYSGLLGPFEIFFKNKMTCFDFIFSGHMTNTIICILLLIKYLNLGKIFTYSIWLFVILEGYFIIAARTHYLIDVEVAAVLTVLVWIILEDKEKLNQTII